MKTSRKRSSASVSLRRSLTLVTISGCLFMVYNTCTICPAVPRFFRAIGASEFHIGLLSGIPMVMLFMYFAGALLTNRVRRRKPAFMFLFISGRLLYIPIAFLPVLFPPRETHLVLPIIMLLIGVNGALTNVACSLWYSWMADLIPHRILNSYWGVRQGWMYFTGTMCFVGVAAFIGLVEWPITTTFPVLVTLAVIAGVTDILLFVRVDEPEHVVVRGKGVINILLQPLKHADYRIFLLFACAWFASIMMAAPFMQLYVLETLQVPVGQATLIWCLHGIGTALAARGWGRLADRHGHKPVMAICLVLKPLIVLTFFLMTRRSVLWALPVALLVDGMLNAGTVVALNGYSIKMAPRENRAMFVAATIGLSGICGGLAAMGGGAILRALSDVSFHALGRHWANFHAVFALSFLMRVGCAFLIHWVREPATSRPVHVLGDLMWGLQTRLPRLPITLYKRRSRDHARKN